MAKPKLLLLSHCLPEPCGPGPAARAWQLLKIASQNSQVDLACVTDGRVNLTQWRRAASNTRELSIDRAGLLCRWLGRDVRRPRWTPGLNQQISLWQQNQKYDAIWCTHPALWDAAIRVPVAQRICDMDDASSLDIHHVNGAWTWMTSSHRADGQHSAGLAHKTLWLPRAVDLAYFLPGLANDQRPRLMLHADGRQRSGRATLDWFARHVWHKVKQAVPEACWDRPTGDGMSAIQSWRDAWVVISPHQDPVQGQWSALQAMAMSRPVVASSQAVATMNVRHGEHLLISHKPSDWVEHCVESLRSAQTRLKLASAGRSFAERCSLTPQMTRSITKKLHLSPVHLPQDDYAMAA